MMFVVSLVEFSKHVQNEISAKVMPKPQNFTADFAEELRVESFTQQLSHGKKPNFYGGKSRLTQVN
jgi:hypothetical protein